MNISESIEKLGVVPVVVLNDANDAKPLAKALCEGGGYLPYSGSKGFHKDYDRRIS